MVISYFNILILRSSLPYFHVHSQTTHLAFPLTSLSPPHLHAYPPKYSFKKGISKPRLVLVFIKVHSQEQFLTQMRASKKAHFPTQFFGQEGRRDRSSSLFFEPVLLFLVLL